MKKSIVILLHISYWAMYLFLVTMLNMLLRMNNPQATLQNLGLSFLFSPLSFGAIIPGLFGFYAGYLLIFNRYLLSKKIPKLFLSTISLSFVFSAITQLIIYLAFNGKGVNWSLETCISMGTFLAFISVAHSSTGMIMQGFIKWFEDIKLKADLNKRNYETEIALLKSQINPHFLFNTINNIDTLIAIDPTSASAYLNKLSDIMRFMLYETQAEKILLSKEIEYIEKYIDLQKIRTSNENFVHFNVSGDASNIYIPSMLFIPFIENAFKHVGSKKTENAINISLQILDKEIIFECQNQFVPGLKFKQEFNGLGNELIKKRIELLYPNSHQLRLINKNNTYKVELKLPNG
jgi:two-component system LytT family sensor kinase